MKLIFVITTGVFLGCLLSVTPVAAGGSTGVDIPGGVGGLPPGPGVPAGTPFDCDAAEAAASLTPSGILSGAILFDFDPIDTTFGPDGTFFFSLSGPPFSLPLSASTDLFFSLPPGGPGTPAGGPNGSIPDTLNFTQQATLTNFSTTSLDGQPTNGAPGSNPLFASTGDAVAEAGNQFLASVSQNFSGQESSVRSSFDEFWKALTFHYDPAYYTYQGSFQVRETPKLDRPTPLGLPTTSLSPILGTVDRVEIIKGALASSYGTEMATTGSGSERLETLRNLQNRSTELGSGKTFDYVNKLNQAEELGNNVGGMFNEFVFNIANDPNAGGFDPIDPGGLNDPANQQVNSPGVVGPLDEGQPLAKDTQQAKDTTTDTQPSAKDTQQTQDTAKDKQPSEGEGSKTTQDTAKDTQPPDKDSQQAKDTAKDEPPVDEDVPLVDADKPPLDDTEKAYREAAKVKEENEKVWRDKAEGHRKKAQSLPDGSAKEKEKEYAEANDKQADQEKKDANDYRKQANQARQNAKQRQADAEKARAEAEANRQAAEQRYKDAKAKTDKALEKIRAREKAEQAAREAERKAQAEIDRQLKNLQTRLDRQAAEARAKGRAAQGSAGGQEGQTGTQAGGQGDGEGPKVGDAAREEATDADRNSRRRQSLRAQVEAALSN